MTTSDSDPRNRVPLLARIEGHLAPRWSRLTEMGNSRILRTSFIWFLAVPPLANLFSRIGPELQISVLGTDWTLRFDLPFSWKVFYFAAAAFTVATTLFYFRCPEIIRRYDSFAQFDAEGKGSRQVRDYFLDFLARRRLDQVSGAVVTGYLTEFTHEYSEPGMQGSLSDVEVEHRGHLIDLVIESHLDSALVSDAFWYVRSIANRANPISAIVCGVFFLLGFGLIAVVLVQNFIYVWDLTFHR